MTLEALALLILALTLGSIPFSVWVGRIGLKKDIRDYGDGNPGAFNVIRAGGLAWGGLALMLDISKAATPVGLANVVFQIDGLPLVLIAIAPLIGHAFSPFLKFKGGKAIAAAGGTWIGLSLWRVPLIGLPALVFWYLTLTSSGWAVIFTMLTALIYLLVSAAPSEWLAVWGLMMTLFIYKHRTELIHPPALRNPPVWMHPFVSR